MNAAACWRQPRTSPPLLVKHRDPSAAPYNVTDTVPYDTRPRSEDNGAGRAQQEHRYTEQRPRLYANVPPAVHAREYGSNTLASSPLTSATEPWRAKSSHHDRPMVDPRPYIAGRQDSLNSTDAAQSYHWSAAEPASVKDESPARTTSSLVTANNVSLPSFAVLHESTQPRLTQSYIAAAVTAPTSTTSCSCSELKPLVQSAAAAAQRLGLALEQNLVALGDQKIYEPVHDHPVRTLERLLNRLTAAESILLRHNTNVRQAYCSSCETTLGLSESSPRGKRLFGEHDMPDAKRPRLEPSGYVSHGSSYPLHRLDMAQPGPQTPHGNPLLPSPSSLVNSGQPFALSRTENSASPPATSYQAGSSLHNVSTSSATSQHIASLEHQMSLKTLSLQSLQAEHTNLLQKCHRERVKTQTIERKCQAADGEINELAAKNDELNDQLRSLEAQLTDLEKRRAAEVNHASREKEQWVRMLEMSSRLQQSAHEQCQTLREDRDRLSNRLASCESCSKEESTGGPEEPQQLATTASKDVQAPHPAMLSSTITNSLQAQVNTFRAAFEHARMQTQELKEKFAEAEQQRQALSEAIESALEGKEQALVGKTATSSAEGRSSSPASTLQALLHQDYGSLEQSQLPGCTTATAATLLAVSSNNVLASDLGLDAAPATSSPEQLLAALGSVPIKGLL